MDETLSSAENSILREPYREYYTTKRKNYEAVIRDRVAEKRRTFEELV